MMRDANGPRALAHVAAIVLIAGVFPGVSGAQDNGQANANGHGGEKKDHGEQGKHSGKDGGGHRRIALDKKQRARLELKTVEARSGRADTIVRAPVELELDPDRRHRVGPRVDAKVKQVQADLGDRVAAGDKLATFDSVALGQAKSRYLAARARYRTAKRELEREQRLAEQQIASEAEVLDARSRAASTRAEMEAAKTALRLYGVSSKAIERLDDASPQQMSRLELRAPAAGVVQHRAVSPGQTVKAGGTPFTVVNTDKLWAMIAVHAERIGEISVGDGVRISIDGVSESFDAEVSWISSAADSKDRRIRVRAIVANPDHKLRPGQFGQAQIFTGDETNGKTTLVPLDAIQRIDGRDAVFVPTDHEGGFRVRFVELGQRGERFVEIRSGVDPGTRVVAKGSFDLKSALTASGRSAAHSH